MDRLIKYVLVFLLFIPLSLWGKAYMGVYTNDLNDGGYDKYGWEQNYGVLIKRVVKNTPADEAGFKNNDILLELNGEKVYTDNQLGKMLDGYKPGVTVSSVVLRKEKKKEIMITLGERDNYKKGYIGVYLRNIEEGNFDEYETEYEHGILIYRVVEKSPASKAGLKKNDIILALNDENIYTRDQFQKMLSKHKVNENIKLTILRNNKKKKYEITLEERKSIDFSFDPLKFSIPDNVFVYKYDYDNPKKWIGIKAYELNEDIKKERNTDFGIIVDKVYKNTPAEKSGLKKKDIILQMNDKKIRSIDDMVRITEEVETDEYADFLILRANKKTDKRIQIVKNENYVGKKIDISIEDGDIKLIINGKETRFKNLDTLLDSLGEKIDKSMELFEGNLEEKMEKLEDNLDKLDDIEIEIEENKKGNL